MKGHCALWQIKNPFTNPPLHFFKGEHLRVTRLGSVCVRPEQDPEPLPLRVSSGSHVSVGPTRTFLHGVLLVISRYKHLIGFDNYIFFLFHQMWVTLGKNKKAENEADSHHETEPPREGRDSQGSLHLQTVGRAQAGRAHRPPEAQQGGLQGGRIAGIDSLLINGSPQKTPLDN